MTSVANTVAMITLAVHTLQPLIFYRLWAPAHGGTGQYIFSVNNVIWY